MAPNVHGALARRVFISHTGQDVRGQDFAASVLKPALQKAGMDVFIDFDSLKPGCWWRAELLDAAAGSAVFVAVLSKTYFQRVWCLMELDLAVNGLPDRPRQTDPYIIPVYIDDRRSITPPTAEQVKQLAQEKLQELQDCRMPTQQQTDALSYLEAVLSNPQRWSGLLNTLSNRQAIRSPQGVLQHHCELVKQVVSQQPDVVQR